MATTYLCNAFSLNMISAPSAEIRMTELTAAEAAERLIAAPETWGWLGPRAICPTIVQCIGHADTAAVFAANLDLDGIAPSRINVSLEPGDTLIVGQYSGPRLPEGATALPEGASIRWLMVTLVA